MDNNRPRPKVMVVDDDSVIRNMLFEFLSRQNYEVSLATNGREALEQLTQADASGAGHAERAAAGVEPDVILLDMNMPVMGGLEVLSAVQKLNKQIMIIMMTGSEIDQVQTALKLGASAWLIKPFSLERLKELLPVGLPLGRNGSGVNALLPKIEKEGGDLRMLKADIGKTAGRVWAYLRENGTIPLPELLNKTREDTTLVNQALGWLAREDKVVFTKEGRMTFVSLTDTEKNNCQPTQD